MTRRDYKIVPENVPSKLDFSTKDKVSKNETIFSTSSEVKKGISNNASLALVNTL